MPKGLTGLAYDPSFLAHDTGPGHPERPERVSAIMSRLERPENEALRNALHPLSAQPSSTTELLSVHPQSHLDEVKRACERARSEGRIYLDEDTPVSPRSEEVARLAAGAVLKACDAVMSGEVSNAFCAIRPPGHHAETGRAMGFCLFNNVAVAARYLQKKHGIGRVLIIDWDVHHGNGTQEIFYEDPSVFYFSTHQYPFYPGTGASSETGAGKGLGTTLNAPMTAGLGDGAFIMAFREKLVPAALDFAPDFILISAGFDAHREDPLAGMKMTEAGFAELTRIARELASKICNDRIVSILEGGYDLDALGRSAVKHLEILSGKP